MSAASLMLLSRKRSGSGPEFYEIPGGSKIESFGVVEGCCFSALEPDQARKVCLVHSAASSVRFAPIIYSAIPAIATTQLNIGRVAVVRPTAAMCTSKIPLRERV